MMPKTGLQHVAKMTDRRQRVAKAYMEGKSQYEIAKGEMVNQATISTDLKWVLENWLTDAVQAYDDKIKNELLKLMHIEQVCWERFYESCKNAETRHTRTKKVLVRSKPDGKPDGKTLLSELLAAKEEMTPVEVTDEMTSKGQVGDKGWIDQAMKAIEMRMKILGILKPDEKNTTINNNNAVQVKFDWNEFHQSMEEEYNDPVDLAVEAVRTIEIEAHKE